jgi:hypothetical protein
LSVRAKGVQAWDGSSDYFNISATHMKNAPQITVIDDFIGKINGFIETSSKVRWPQSGALKWIEVKIIKLLLSSNR